ncbi:MAG TPA: hypothetical protein PLJ78_04895 [Anaerolineae bacterium]|nr:hypothetical protein [Anaerolineae bacterium]HQK13270.1 hypothetical protein [Anaerolineae bacterium]
MVVGAYRRVGRDARRFAHTARHAGRPRHPSELAGVNATLPVTSTWRVEYYTNTTTIYTATDPYSTTRSLVLTQNVQNYQWYTVTLSTVGVTPALSDTVRVMPTDRFVYLPVTLKNK